MLYKKVNLFLMAVMLVVGFFTVPVYNNWLNGKLLGDKIDYQMAHMSLADRKTSRYGFSYVVYQNIAAKVTDPKTAIILMPPNDYLKTQGVKTFATPEPATFYYYTGLVSVLANSPDVERANWELMVKSDQQILLRKMPGKQYLDSLIALYRKYNY